MYIQFDNNILYCLLHFLMNCTHFSLLLTLFLVDQSYSSSSSTTANTTTTKTQRDPYRQLPKKEEPPEEVRDSHPLLGGWSTVKRYETEQNEEEEENQLSVKYVTKQPFKRRFLFHCLTLIVLMALFLYWLA